ncbi:DNA polymerase I, partial [Patescibacteria group bacterium]
ISDIPLLRSPSNNIVASLESIIVTGDLDTLQLVDDRTKVFTMRKGMSDTVLYDEEAVMDRYGLRPDQMIDYKALRGDPSDNIPGVRGIGEKTGTDLIKKFGTFDALYDAIENDTDEAQELRKSVRDKLLTHKKNAEQARHLVTIRRDVDVDFSLKDAEYVPVTQDMMMSLFEELQFMRMLKQLPKKVEPKNTTTSLFAEETENVEEVASVESIQTADRLSEVLGQLQKTKSIAFRTTSADEDPITPNVLAFAIGDAKRQFILRSDLLRAVVPAIQAFFADYDGTVVCHDLKREVNVLRSLGITLDNILFDLMIGSYLLHSGDRRHTLDAILSYHRTVPVPEKKMDDDMRLARLQVEIPHLVSVAEELSEELRDQELTALNEDVEIPLAYVLARMEFDGIAIDAKHFEKLSKEIGKKVDSLTKTIHTLAGEEFNINSPAQMKVILFEKLGISPQGIKKTQKGGGLSTAASELEKIRSEHKIIDSILTYRELAKLQSTYIDALPPLAHEKTGRIHANFNQTVTATGRLSSSNPNLQNIPTAETEYGKAVRDGFVAKKGFVLLAADYSQIELRLAAHIAKEKIMIDAFNAGEDIHLRTAATMFGEKDAKDHRRVAKVINFGILYGMGPTRLADNTGVSFQEAREYIEKYFSAHTGIADYIEDTKQKIQDDGFVETLFGRKRYFRNFGLMNQREQGEAERQAVNMPLQGTQADMIKVAMVRLDQHLKDTYGEGADTKARMVSQVHDELVLEVHESVVDDVAKAIAPIMENVIKLDVPVLVNISTGKRWGSMK